MSVMSASNRFYDRDLSWLSFNYRVLMEASRNEVPLLERLRFIAIYSSNLDEFFRVRVADIRSFYEIDKDNINAKLGFIPKELLAEIHKEVARQLPIYGKALVKILQQLEKEGIVIMDNPVIDDDTRRMLGEYFRSRVLAYLRPHIFKKSINTPFLDNQHLYLAVTLSKNQKKRYGYVNIPSDKLPRFFHHKNGKISRFFYLDDILREHLDIVFPGYTVEECLSIKLNKDADLAIDDEYSGDLVEKIERQLQKRNLGPPSRFLYDKSISTSLLQALMDNLGLKDEDLVAGGRYHNLNDLWQIPNTGKNSLEFDFWAPVPHRDIKSHRTIFQSIDHRDQLLHFPYQSYDYILQFFSEAAIDPKVRDIYVTFYRMARHSVIGEALISAANNGKKVVVFMELKARFDEENNLKWAARMKAAGVYIVYSIPGLKVHAKVALIRKKSSRNKPRYYAFFGTGNLNEKTAGIYSDLGLLTKDPRLCGELEQIFRYLHERRPPGTFEALIVSQFNAIERFTGMIDREIANVRSGQKGMITIKLNNLEERPIIEKLYEAAAAGVDVQLMVRSICCLIPEKFGIRVSRLVDRFLEHARIFYFHNAGDEEIYMGSSDWMKRNLHHRIEVSFPVYDQDIREEIKHFLKLQFEDTTNRIELNERMENVAVDRSGGDRNAQSETYQFLKDRHANP